LLSNFHNPRGTVFRTARTRNFVMEPILIESYTLMLKAHPNTCSVDRILEDPEMRNEFLDRVRAVERSEYDILRTLHNLRKRSKLPLRGD
jgi:hypothetical protein